MKFIKDRHPNKTGVIYCLGRDKCESVAKQLRDKGLNAKHFHAKLDPSDKERIQTEWQSGAVHIIVATVRNFLSLVRIHDMIYRSRSGWALTSLMVIVKLLHTFLC